MYKVLLVDDEPFILEGLNYLINWSELGLEIAGQASNGTEAMDIIENEPIHILITDIKMPKMDGLELIRNVKKMDLNIRFIILSGYDDFEYVKAAIKLGIENYILKPLNQEELTSTLLNTIDNIENDMYRKIQQEESKYILRNNILCRWMYNNISNAELQERSSIINIDLGSKEYYVSIIKILYDHGNHQNQCSDDKSLISLKVKNICDEIIQKHDSVSIFCDLNGDIILLFSSNSEESQKPLVKAVLENCICNINKFLGLNVFVTIGSREPEYKTVYMSYAHSRDLQDYCFILPINSIIDYEDTQKTDMTIQKEIDIDLVAFKGLIVDKKKEESCKFIESTLKQLNNVKGITPLYIQSIILEIISTISKEVKLLKGSNYIIYSGIKNIFSTNPDIVTVDELINWLKSVVSQAIDYLQSEYNNVNPIIRRILCYISNNYSKDLSLKILSSSFNVNAAYLGQLFKKETGEVFTNYLNSVRIEKAKELFMKTNYKTNEILEMVGFTDANYFYTTFKKITGLSVSQARDLK